MTMKVIVIVLSRLKHIMVFNKQNQMEGRMKMRFRCNLKKILFSTTALAVIPVAFAQGEEVGEDNQIDEIIVTAQKRAQSLQDVVGAISAIKGEDLDILNISDAFDLSDKVPGVVFTNVQGYRRTIAIRGIGNEVADNAATKPGVAYHVDGVFMSNDFALFEDLVDIERIEVVRGPDGTLYGNSSSGGMVNVITKKPNFDKVDGFIDATFGSYSTTRVRGTINIPLAPTLAVKLTGSHRERDGYTKNLAIIGNDLDDENDDSLGVQLLWAPSEDISILASYHSFTSDTNGPALKGGFDTVSSDPREVAHDTLESFKIDNESANIILNWDTSVAHVKALFSYQSYEMQRVLDADRSSLTANDPAPLPLVGVIDLLGELPIRQHVGTLRQEDETYTAEINISSVENDSAFDWIVGAFYMDTEIFSNTANFFDSGFDGNPVNTATLAPNPFANPDVDFINADFRNFETYSFFGQMGINLMDDRLRLSGGLRYTKNKFEDERCSLFCVVNGRTSTRTPSAEADNVTFKAAINYNVTEDNMVYVSVATGIKPTASNNGFTTDDTGAGFFPEIFEEEKVTAYEFGSKNKFFDNRMTFNVAAYYYDINNFLFQSAGLNLTGSGVSGGANLPNSEVYGIEIESRITLLDNLWIDGNLTIAESNIKTGRLAVDRAEQTNITAALTAPVSQGGSGLNPFASPLDPAIIAAINSLAQDVTGNDLPKIPDLVANIRLTYVREIPDFGDATISLIYTHRGEYFARVFNAERDVVESYDMLDLNVQIHPEDSNWTGEFAIQNIFNTASVSSVHTDDFFQGFTSKQFLPPRVITVRARYDF
ncbi:MAG: hypothetical protein COB49_06835 [Alphaproteobacteria bacterium]|nr:MAG: hypothetical protein COB49_06835 [Alphaproteobacteria bacterium]